MLVGSCTDESELDEEPAPRRKKAKVLKSGKTRTADSTVVKRITWTHELVYTLRGEPVTYELISLPQFVTGYLSVLDTVKSGERHIMLKHPKELMADASTYRWEAMRAYHGVWLQQLENGRAEWHDIELKFEYRPALVWNSSRLTTSRSQ